MIKNAKSNGKKKEEAKIFVEKIINDKKIFLDSTPPPLLPTASSQPSTNMSEEKIDELCHQLVRRMFGFGKETARVLNGGQRGGGGGGRKQGIRKFFNKQIR